jgi:general transcription factor 3C polypeptide 3 (transcription factor C subunit 4)
MNPLPLVLNTLCIQARRAYLAILKHIPHNVDVLTELRQLLVEFGELKLCATLFQEAYDYYTKAYPLGQSQASSDTANIDPNLLDSTAGASSSTQSPVAAASPFGLIEVLVLADLYNTLSQHHRAINVIRAGVRWLQGRGKQHLWDKCADDREYDLEGFVREGDGGGNTGGELEGESMKQGFFPLDINARHRLAVARLKLGHLDEGKVLDQLVNQIQIDRSDRCFPDTRRYHPIPERSRVRSFIRRACRRLL